MVLGLRGPTWPVPLGMNGVYSIILTRPMATLYAFGNHLQIYIVGKWKNRVETFISRSFGWVRMILDDKYVQHTYGICIMHVAQFVTHEQDWRVSKGDCSSWFSCYIMALSCRACLQVWCLQDVTLSLYHKWFQLCVFSLFTDHSLSWARFPTVCNYQP